MFKHLNNLFYNRLNFDKYHILITEVMIYSYAKRSLGLLHLIIFPLLLLILCGYQAGHAQASLTVRGKVVDSYGNALPGVSVLNGSKAFAAGVTDSIGRFSIIADKGDKLAFIHEKFDAYQVKASGSDHLYIRLEEKYLVPHEKIHVLYGTQNRNSILGSVSAAYTPQLITTPESQYTFALQGRLPGLYLNQSRGWPTRGSATLIAFNSIDGNSQASGTIGAAEPGDNTQMSIALRGQSPVTIIDGVRRNFYSMPPENIESVTLLKDALSTILLGQESSRGVLLVTTKRPESGDMRFSFTAQTALQTPINLPKPLPAYQHAWLYNEAATNDGSDPFFTQSDFNSFLKGDDPVGHPDINWFDVVLRDNSPVSRYDLLVTGGERARYTMSAGYMKKEGMFREDPGTAYSTNANINRYTIGTNIEVDVNDYFEVGVDIFGRIENTNEPGAGISSIWSNLLSIPNNASRIFNPDGSLAGNSRYQTNLYGLAMNSGYTTGNSRDVLANLNLKYDFRKYLPGLWMKVMGNVSVSATTFIDRSKGFTVFDLKVDDNGDTTYQRYGTATDQKNDFVLTSFGQYWYGQFAVGYGKQLKRDSIAVMLFADQRQVTVNYDLPGKYTNLAAKVSYNRDEKYFAEAAVNYSGYNRYPPGEQFGLFYAAGLGWEMGKENFVKDNLPWLNQLKWRVTYGRTGNANVGYFAYQYYFVGVADERLANPHPTWEKADKWNAGVDMGLFKNRLQFTADYYYNKYFDLMMTRGKANPLLGNSYPRENIGENLYEGGEISLTYNDHAGSLNWFVTGNLSIMKTRILYMDEVDRDYTWNERTGKPVGQRFGYIADGLFQNQEEVDNSAHIENLTPGPGDIKYRDLNGDGVINFFDEAPIGTQKPLIYYGLNVGMTYKGFDVNVLFQGVTNRDIYLSGNGAMSFNRLLSNYLNQAWEHDMGRWTPQNAETATSPRLSAIINQNNYLQTSSYWLRSGNYLRLKNAEVGYNLPYSWIRRLRVGSIRIFANGLNLWTHAADKDIDPEVSYQTGSAYPLQRITNVGINIKF